MQNSNYKEQEIYVKVPKIRVGALIGKYGQNKNEIEELTKTKLKIDSESGDVTILRNKSDAFTFYRTEHVIKAIGRGFSPTHAKLLLEQEYYLDVIELRDYGIVSDKAMEIKRARVIGTKGSIREFIEDAFDCNIAVQGKTISIIGTSPKIEYAKDAIETILKGANISAIKKQIQKKVTKIKENRLNDDTGEGW